MSDDRSDLMLEIRKSIQNELALVKREQSSQGLRRLAIEDHQRGMMTSLHGLMTSIHAVEVDMANVKDRVDRIEQRLGLMDTEH